MRWYQEKTIVTWFNCRLLGYFIWLENMTRAISVEMIMSMLRQQQVLLPRKPVPAHHHQKAYQKD